MTKLTQNPYIDKLNAINFEELSKKHEFQRNSEHKITLCLFIKSYIDCIVNQLFSLQNWSNRLMFLLDATVTKQALQAKFYERHFTAVSAVLNEVLKQDLQERGLKNVRNWSLFASFNRVLLQDSTCVPLHSSLAAHFPGTTSKGQITATARIQSVYELKQETFLRFALQSYRDNDQKDSGSILDLLEANDMVLRDLGYFSLAIILKIMGKGAYFVMPYPSGTNIYKQDGTILNLYKILVINNLNSIDYNVFIGSGKKVPVRLVAMKLSEEAKQKKIANAKKTASSTTKHSAEYYELLGWAIYITNVSNETWTVRNIGFAYRVRWRIETIFKAWKSAFRLKDFVYDRKMCEYRCKIQLTIILIYFALIFKEVFAFFEIKTKEFYSHEAKFNRFIEVKELSLIKLANLIHTAADIIFQQRDWEKLVPLIINAAKYEKRKDRHNFETFTYY